MKKIMTAIVLMSIASKLYSCDICGCGVGGYYIGILPEFKKKFVGLRYQYKNLRSHVSAAGSTSYLTTDETYRIAELWGGWNIGNRFRVLAFIPLNNIERVNQGARKHKTGLGDIALTGFYKLLSKEGTIKGDQLLIQQLWVGAGIKLPTGKYREADKSASQQLQNTFQLGTGSLDFTLNTMYDIRWMDAGLNSNLSYKMNTSNSYNYRYGNKFTCQLTGYYKFRLFEKITVAPATGLLFETASRDMNENNRVVEESGGRSALATFGNDISAGRLMIGINYQHPVAGELAGGRAIGKDRIITYLTIAF